jgi:phosphatidylglycerophosphatase A
MKPKYVIGDTLIGTEYQESCLVTGIVDDNQSYRILGFLQSEYFNTSDRISFFVAHKYFKPMDKVKPKDIKWLDTKSVTS